MSIDRFLPQLIARATVCNKKSLGESKCRRRWLLIDSLHNLRALYPCDSIVGTTFRISELSYCLTCKKLLMGCDRAKLTQIEKRTRLEEAEGKSLQLFTCTEIFQMSYRHNMCRKHMCCMPLRPLYDFPDSARRRGALHQVILKQPK